MTAPLQLAQTDHHVELRLPGGELLFRYVHRPDTPANESPRPYAHPVCSSAGDTLTNFRPNDHPWHHALSFTLTSVDGANFWGGPSHRAGDGYQWRDDHGRQVHLGWEELAPERLVESLAWRSRADEILLHERRTLHVAAAASRWSLRWTAELRNATSRPLALGNYHSLGGLAGSHYTGLQFRGARDLLDEHGDATIGVSAEGGAQGESAVHGGAARWMEWSCQHDGSLRRTRIRFEMLDGPVAWFVRARNPLAAFAFQRGDNQSLAVGATLRLDHLLTFTCA